MISDEKLRDMLDEIMRESQVRMDQAEERWRKKASEAERNEVDRTRFDIRRYGVIDSISSYLQWAKKKGCLKFSAIILRDYLKKVIQELDNLLRE